MTPEYAAEKESTRSSVPSGCRSLVCGPATTIAPVAKERPLVAAACGALLGAQSAMLARTAPSNWNRRRRRLLAHLITCTGTLVDSTVFANLGKAAAAVNRSRLERQNNAPLRRRSGQEDCSSAWADDRARRAGAYAKGALIS